MEQDFFECSLDELLKISASDKPYIDSWYIKELNISNNGWKKVTVVLKKYKGNGVIAIMTGIHCGTGVRTLSLVYEKEY